LVELVIWADEHRSARVGDVHASENPCGSVEATCQNFRSALIIHFWYNMPWGRSPRRRKNLRGRSSKDGDLS